MTGRLDLEALQHLLVWRQSGVVARRQVLELGGDDNDIERMIRRRELTVVLSGVYVNHTGPLSRQQREWAAVLAYWPAALTRESALHNRPLDVVEIAVALDRKLVGTERIWIHRMPDFTRRVNWRGAPPTIDIEHATIDVMSSQIAKGDVARAFTLLADICQTRRTSPQKIAATLASRERVSGRRMIASMISDLADGACSVLERGYIQRVERPHGLPSPGARTPAPPPAVVRTRTSTTTSSASWSNWMAARSTTTPPLVTRTRSATSPNSPSTTTSPPA